MKDEEKIIELRKELLETVEEYCQEKQATGRLDYTAKVFIEDAIFMKFAELELIEAELR